MEVTLDKYPTSFEGGYHNLPVEWVDVGQTVVGVRLSDGTTFTLFERDGNLEVMGNNQLLLKPHGGVNVVLITEQKR